MRNRPPMPEKALSDILTVIQRDVRRMKKRTPLGTILTAEDALTLTRYASALSHVLSEQEKIKSKKLKEADKLSTEELIKRLQEGKGPAKP